MSECNLSKHNILVILPEKKVKKFSCFATKKKLVLCYRVILNKSFKETLNIVLKYIQKNITSS